MKKLQNRMLAAILAATITFTSTGMKVFAEEGDTLKTEETIVTEETVSAGDFETLETKETLTEEEAFSEGNSAVYEGDTFRVTFYLVGKWDGGYNANISIENTGEIAIENWYLGFDSKNDISNIWNAEVYSCENEKYIIKNAGWNKQIAVNSSVEFGISGQQKFEGFPKEYRLIGESTNVKTEDYSVEYYVDSDWGNGFTGTILITNNTDETMEDWVLEFDFDNDISSIWNGEIISHEGEHYVIRNAGYNRDIGAQESVSIGFTVDDGCAENLFSNSLLYKYSSKSEVEEGDKEPLEDIGEAYYKEPSKEDVIVNEETGIMYVKNQVLVSAYPGLPKSIIEEIVSEIDADIVGYIELTNDYQLEFRENKSADELDTMIDYIRSFSFISYASLNIAEERKSEMTTTNDKLYDDGKEYKRNKAGESTLDSGTDSWNEDVPDGDNWGLEALHVLTAWDNKADFQPVKVGIYDRAFSKHEYLSFEHLFNNSSVSDDGHGTHVAGILAARHNNGIGVSGVATNVKLYAYSQSGSEYGSSMGDKHAYATLIGNHVKVINVSAGGDMDEQFAASRGNTKAINSIQSRADILEEYLKKLVMAGYDFLIVTSAGNTEDKEFVEDSMSRYGYRRYDSNKDNADDILSGKVLALYDCPLTAIKDPCIKNRIIVVGAVGHSITDGTVTYNYASFSNVGNRVDVCAPGVDILSTVPTNIDPSGYQLRSGTSMACPYISGIAALMYQINPAMKATTVRHYLCTSGSITVKDVHKNTYSMPDASVCCTRAKNAGKEENNDLFLPSGILTGNVYSVNHSLVPKVDIAAMRKSTGESNLDDYCFRFSTDEQDDFVVSLPQGTYDLIVYGNPYLPYCMKDVVINPDETKYIEIGLIYDGQYDLSQETKAYGTVIDALNGDTIENATVRLRTGWDNTSGSYVIGKTGTECSAKTDSSGKFAISASRGQYTAEITKAGYITGYFNVIALGNEAVSETTMVLTPELPEDEYRIVLTWGKTPRDLDSHLTYYVDNAKKFQVYYANRSGTYAGEKVAVLDLDDGNGYGPETVTLTLKADTLEKGVFKYSVHNYSGKDDTASKDLSLSGAVVRVYTGNKMPETFYIPKNNTGTVWHVFDIDKNGIIPVNEFYSSHPKAIR
ncbi:MAG: S8 family serine peptidase [Acetatifactor sp.]|nr:S8 family serine peptidase [Acetatifactor sp.]